MPGNAQIQGGLGPWAGAKGLVRDTSGLRAVCLLVCPPLCQPLLL